MGAFRRSLWYLEQYGRLTSFVALVVLATAIGAGTAAVLRAVTKLPLPWLITLWVAVGVVVIVALALATARVLGAGLRLTQRADSCWITDETDLGEFVLTGVFLLANTDPDHSLRPVSIELRKIRIKGKRHRVKTEGNLPRPGESPEEIAPDTTGDRIVLFRVERFPPVADATTKVKVQDQFGHPHTGQIVFRVPPTPPS
jgi:hypothetical protein